MEEILKMMLMQTLMSRAVGGTGNPIENLLGGLVHAQNGVPNTTNLPNSVTISKDDLESLAEIIASKVAEKINNAD